MSNGMKKNLEKKLGMDERQRPNSFQLSNAPNQQSMQKYKTDAIIKIPKDLISKVNEIENVNRNDHNSFQPKAQELKRNAGN